MDKSTSNRGDAPFAVPRSTASLAGRELCGDLDMRIDRDGLWYYHGSPIGRKELVRLFASVLSRDEAGDYWLITPAEIGRIVVEDAPFIVVELTTRGAGADRVIDFRTNIDETFTVDADHPIFIVTRDGTGEARPYVTVRTAAGLDARIARPVYYELVALGGEEVMDGETVFGVWSSGTFFPMGRLDTEQ